jgi:hypothetical protein
MKSGTAVPHSTTSRTLHGAMVSRGGVLECGLLRDWYFRSIYITPIRAQVVGRDDDV